jgi:hypothetical protein
MPSNRARAAGLALWVERCVMRGGETAPVDPTACLGWPTPCLRLRPDVDGRPGPPRLRLRHVASRDYREWRRRNKEPKRGRKSACGRHFLYCCEGRRRWAKLPMAEESGSRTHQGPAGDPFSDLKSGRPTGDASPPDLMYQSPTCGRALPG